MSSKLRIGYSFAGHLADYKYDRHGRPVSRPDGNATYSWSVICAAMEAGHTVIPLQEDRDEQAVKKHGMGAFAAFSQWKRLAAYQHLQYHHNSSWTGVMGVFPELDVLLLEWRFPIHGRNTRQDVGKPEFQPDLLRQWELIEHYSGTDTRIIVWDLDGKIEDSDDDTWSIISGGLLRPDAVFETAMKPAFEPWADVWQRVEPPFLMEDVLQKSFYKPSHEKSLVYIGSRYERDDVIDEWIKPASEHIGVEFHGKWDGDCRERWPNVKFFDRCTVSDFHEIYRDAACVPLLAKRSYMKRGFITPRPWEALLFGSLPVGLRGHLGIEKYVNEGFVADDPADLAHITYMAAIDLNERKRLREDLAHKLRFMDARHFVKKIEDVVG